MIQPHLIRLWAAATTRVAMREERGASLVEYALLVALIAIVCVAAVAALGSSTAPPYSQLGSGIAS